MATEEARALLDALMGGNRNAPLPPGAAIPTRKRRHADNGKLLLPGQRRRSCFDPDIDPLYTAWGVDVYELFVNTKSDYLLVSAGGSAVNPYIVDEDARQEYLTLPQHKRQALGFEYQLFQKLLELVRQCDRMVARNKEKLAQEVNRKLSQRSGQDFVEDVDDEAVEELARCMVEKQELEGLLQEHVEQLEQAVSDEQAAKEKIEPMLQAQRLKNTLMDVSVEEKSGTEQNTETNSVDKIKEETTAENGGKVGGSIKDEHTSEFVVKQEPMDVVDQHMKISNTNTVSGTDFSNFDEQVLQQLQMELGSITLRKQHILFKLAQLIQQCAALTDSVDTQLRQLNYVRSDISTDKTVCEISGNFMSSRDADERIAAHYAGKQYVGWKLVRDKLSEMIKKYGRYGPPPPQNNNNSNNSNGPVPPPMRGPPQPSRMDGYAPRMDDRYHGGGGGGGRGPPLPPAHDRNRGGRWERGPPPQQQPPPHFNRGGRGGPPPPNWRR